MLLHLLSLALLTSEIPDVKHENHQSKMEAPNKLIQYRPEEKELLSRQLHDLRIAHHDFDKLSVMSVKTHYDVSGLLGVTHT